MDGWLHNPLKILVQHGHLKCLLKDMHYMIWVTRGHACSTFIWDIKGSRRHVDRSVAKRWRSGRQSDWNVGVWLVLSGRVEGEWRWAMTSWCRTVLTGGINGKNSSTQRAYVCVCVCVCTCKCVRSWDSYFRREQWSQPHWHADKHTQTPRHMTWLRCQLSLPVSWWHTKVRKCHTSTPK